MKYVISKRLYNKLKHADFKRNIVWSDQDIIAHLNRTLGLIYEITELKVAG